MLNAIFKTLNSCYTIQLLSVFVLNNWKLIIITVYLIAAESAEIRAFILRICVFLYNINDCIEYITKSLRKNGFLTQNLPPPNTNYLYISWKIEDVNVNKKKLLLT